MNIIIVGSMRYTIYSAAFYKGFINLGHQVSVIDTYKYRYDNYLLSDLQNRILDKFNIGYPLLKLNKDIIKNCTLEHPNFVFFYYCCGIYPSTIMTIKNMGIKIFTYCNDDPYGKFLKKPWNWKLFKSFQLADWNFVYRKKNVIDFNKDGIVNVSVLLPYFISENNFPEKVNRDIKLSFIGHWENDGRDEYIQALLDSKLPLTIFGDYVTWGKSTVYSDLKEKGMITPGKRGSEYNHTINRMQIALVFLSKLNHDTYTRRCFEIPATMTLMLCEYTDDMNELFPENVCAVYFRNPQELVNKAKYLIEHPDEVKRMGNNAYERLKTIGGNETDRCQEIINKFLSLV